MSKHGFTYVGKGARVSYGVPTRDISAEEFARMNPLDQRHVMQSDLYREVKKSTAPASKPAGERTQGGGDS